MGLKGVRLNSSDRRGEWGGVASVNWDSHLGSNYVDQGLSVAYQLKWILANQN